MCKNQKGQRERTARKIDHTYLSLWEKEGGCCAIERCDIPPKEKEVHEGLIDA